MSVYVCAHVCLSCIAYSVVMKAPEFLYNNNLHLHIFSSRDRRARNILAWLGLGSATAWSIDKYGDFSHSRYLLMFFLVIFHFPSIFLFPISSRFYAIDSRFTFEGRSVSLSISADNELPGYNPSLIFDIFNPTFFIRSAIITLSRALWHLLFSARIYKSFPAYKFANDIYIKQNHFTSKLDCPFDDFLFVFLSFAFGQTFRGQNFTRQSKTFIQVLFTARAFEMYRILSTNVQLQALES